MGEKGSCPHRVSKRGSKVCKNKRYRTRSDSALDTTMQIERRIKSMNANIFFFFFFCKFLIHLVFITSLAHCLLQRLTYKNDAHMTSLPMKKKIVLRLKVIYFR